MKKIFLLCFFLWQLERLYAQKMDLTIIHAMETAIQNQTFPNIHSVLISYEGNLIYENYWAGKDYKHGKHAGVVAHGKDSLHTIQSVSKSIFSACIGIALKQGKIKSIHQRPLNFFPNMLLWIQD